MNRWTPFCSTRLCAEPPTRPCSHRHTQLDTRASHMTQADTVSSPHPFPQHVPRPDTCTHVTPSHTQLSHTQPVTHCPPNHHSLCHTPMTTATPSESCREGSALALAHTGTHSLPLLTCVCVCTHHAHTHAQVICKQPSKAYATDSSCPSQNQPQQLAVCPVHLSVRSLEKTQGYLHALWPAACHPVELTKAGFYSFPTLWGQEPSGLLAWPGPSCSSRCRAVTLLRVLPCHTLVGHRHFSNG